MTRSLLCGIATAAFVFVFGAAARADDACWQLVFSAIRHEAALPHAAYISYSETLSIFADELPLERADADITYRDDGLASVDDDRWARPYLSTILDPGPPVLGPYGESRESWLQTLVPDATLPLIADVHNRPLARCANHDSQIIDGVAFEHVVLPDAPADKQALKALWIDPKTLAIARLVVSGYLDFYDTTDMVGHVLTDYTLDMQETGGYTVLRRATWTYVLHVYDQSSNLHGEYDFGNYQFTAAPPPGTLFADASPTK